MTGYTVHSGTTIKFSEGWDRVFQEQAAKSAKNGNKAEKSAKKTSTSGTAQAKARAKRAAKKKKR